MKCTVIVYFSYCSLQVIDSQMQAKPNFDIDISDSDEDSSKKTAGGEKSNITKSEQKQNSN